MKLDDTHTLVLCLKCGSSFAFPINLMPSSRFICVECWEGEYTRLTAS